MSMDDLAGRILQIDRMNEIFRSMCRKIDDPINITMALTISTSSNN